MNSLRVMLVLALAGWVYQSRWRRPVLTWGATTEEAASRLPGDELLDDADGVATRPIDIDAPASAVWPWLGSLIMERKMLLGIKERAERLASAENGWLGEPEHQPPVVG